jgi:CubicO group peptidase (beta-lactamase class C family)
MAGPANRVREYLDGLIEAGYSPGIQYAHLLPDGVFMTHHAGMANILDMVAVQDRTTFNGYSVTKTFTAAAVLKLVERGQLSLDLPIAEFMPHLPYRPSPTLRQVLTHTGGLPNPNPLSWCHLDGAHETFDAARFAADIVAANPRLRSRPGSTYHYSNLGYIVLGMLIENTTGWPYPDFVAEHLIRPLELAESESLAFGISHPPDHAHGCVARRSLINLALGFFIDRGRFLEGGSGRWLQLRHLHVNGAAYGGIIGNCKGFARYLQALLSNDSYMTPTSRSLFFTATAGTDGASLTRSLGWFAGSLHGEPYFTHAGGAAGYYCEIRVYPRLARGSVVMTNRTGIRDERLLDRIDSNIIAVA